MQNMVLTTLMVGNFKEIHHNFKKTQVIMLYVSVTNQRISPKTLAVS